MIEALWIKILLQKQSYLNICIYYGKQESRSSAEAISDELHLLETETARFASQQHHVLLLGDFNAKIGSDNFGIPNGDANISRSGQLLRRLIHNCHLDILNSSTVCTGVWTRINTKNVNQKSILDYALASKSLTPFVTEMLIDEEEEYKLFGKNKSDHNTIILKINLQTCYDTSNTHIETWKFNSTTDWSTFDNCVRHNETICNLHKSTSCMTEYFQSWHTEVHTSALDVIGKWKISNINQRPSNPILKTAMANKSCARKLYELAIRVHDTKNMQSLLNNYKMHQTTVRETILSIEATRTDRFLKHMLDTGGVNSKCFWNIKRRICQSNLEDLTAIIDDQGNRLYHSNEILNYTAKYYEDLYTPKFPLISQQSGIILYLPKSRLI